MREKLAIIIFESIQSFLESDPLRIDFFEIYNQVFIPSVWELAFSSNTGQMKGKNWKLELSKKNLVLPSEVVLFPTGNFKKSC